jgi:hypothetical protein
MINKLNKALSKMDCLSSIQSVNKPDTQLRLSFTCPDGGQYEDVTLELDFEDPITFHLPFWLQAKFQVYFCESDQFEKIIPKDSIDKSGHCLQFYINDLPSSFYIHFMYMSWRVKGQSAYIKNDQELLEEDHYPPIELPPDFKEQLAKTEKMLDKGFKAFMKAVTEDSEDEKKR